MSWRTVIISSRCKLDYKMGYLVVRSLETKRVFLDEIAILMVENPAVSFTGCLLEALVDRKIKIIFCDHTHSPVAELMPYHAAHNSSLKIRKQMAWTTKVKESVWKEIVIEKICKQAEFLKELGKTKEQHMLLSYTDQVELMDETNREGHAAKVYFNALFGMKFNRNADSPINSALNYAYSLILSAFNREVVASGYLTQLGIFHENMFNHFNLSCDLMEPFRILADRMVYKMKPDVFASAEKHSLWDLLHQTVMIDSCNQTVLNAIRIYTKSVLEAIENQDLERIRFFEWV